MLISRPKMSGFAAGLLLAGSGMADAAQVQVTVLADDSEVGTSAPLPFTDPTGPLTESTSIGAGAGSSTTTFTTILVDSSASVGDFHSVTGSALGETMDSLTISAPGQLVGTTGIPEPSPAPLALAAAVILIIWRRSTV